MSYQMNSRFAQLASVGKDDILLIFSHLVPIGPKHKAKVVVEVLLLQRQFIKSLAYRAYTLNLHLILRLFADTIATDSKTKNRNYKISK